MLRYDLEDFELSSKNPVNRAQIIYQYGRVFIRHIYIPVEYFTANERSVHFIDYKQRKGMAKRNELIKVEKIWTFYGETLQTLISHCSRLNVALNLIEKFESLS